MNSYNFTERVRKVLAMAREEAAALHHEYVGTEHMLLAVIREGEGVATAVLQNLGIDLDDVRKQILVAVTAGSGTGPATTDLPYTSRAKRALELSMTAARDFNHSYVGTEHLLIGLMAEGRNIAAQVLMASGATLDVVRQETLRLLGTENTIRTDPPVTGSISLVSIVVLMSGGKSRRGEYLNVADAIEFLKQTGHEAARSNEEQ